MPIRRGAFFVDVATEKRSVPSVRAFSLERLRHVAIEFVGYPYLVLSRLLLTLERCQITAADLIDAIWPARQMGCE